MGSLVAILGRSAVPDASQARRMLAASPHRGAEAGVLVHGSSVLAVSDSPDRAESSLASDGEAAAAFVGTLDNLAELAEELRFGTPARDLGTPAQVLLAAFRAFGPEAVGRLRGTFGAVVAEEDRVWCLRDQMGFRSMFVRDDPRWFLAATEAKQVVAGTGRAPEVDLDVVEATYYGEYDADTPCALRGVRRLAKGSIVEADRDGARTRRYWHPERLLETARLGPEELAERFHHLMEQAARRCLLGDDVVSLSGGIDSPAVAAYAAPEHLERTGEPLAALTVVYPRFPSTDERSYVEEMARAAGMVLHTYEESHRCLQGVEEWAALLDGPVQTYGLDESAEHYRYARRLGYRTMLTGELAEWLVERRHYLISHLLLNGRFGPLWEHIAGQRSKGVSVKAIARQLGAALVPRRVEALYLRRSRGGMPVPEWVDEQRLRDRESRYATAPRRRWLDDQVALPRGVTLHEEADEIVESVCGIRVRRPFGDVDLWEFFVSLPAEVKQPSVRRKALLRELLRGRVPDRILDRTDKTVFDQPMMARVDYQALRRWLIEPPVRLRGIDYEALASHLEREDLDLGGLLWAQNLAAVQAWLAAWAG
jgi:asparagine synthase (glutamine-hydrolysing)